VSADPLSPAAAAAVDAAQWTLAAADTSRIVLVDGVYLPAASDLTGCGAAASVGMLSQAGPGAARAALTVCS
jgi:hypothetical protein